MMTVTLFLGPLILLASNFVYIFLKAYQQKNVMHSDYMAMVPTSFAMAFTEYMTVGIVAASFIQDGVIGAALSILALGIGGASGGCLGVYLNDKRRSNNG